MNKTRRFLSLLLTLVLTLSPVSYTHLDVYKRQTTHATASPTTGRSLTAGARAAP